MRRFLTITALAAGGDCANANDVMPMPMREWTRERSPGGWTQVDVCGVSRDILGYPIVIGVKTPRSLKYFDEIEATELSVSRLVANSRFQDG